MLDATLHEVSFQALDRTFLPNRREFFLRPILLRVAHIVARHAERHAFEKIRARTVAQNFDRLARGRKYGRQVVAVDRLRRYGVWRGKTTHVRDVRVFLATSELGVPIVLTDEQHRKAPECGDVQRLVERTGARCTVTKEHHADVLLALRLRSPRGARGESEVACHNTGRAQHAIRCVDEVHRAAAAATQAVFPAENFGERRLKVASLGEHMAVAAVTGEQHVVASEMRAHADGNRFLAGRQVWKSGNLARGGEPLHLSLEQPYPPERVIHLLPVIERRCSHIPSPRVTVEVYSNQCLGTDRPARPTERIPKWSPRKPAEDPRAPSSRLQFGTACVGNLVASATTG